MAFRSLLATLLLVVALVDADCATECPTANTCTNSGDTHTCIWTTPSFAVGRGNVFTPPANALDIVFTVIGGRGGEAFVSAPSTAARGAGLVAEFVSAERPTNFIMHVGQRGEAGILNGPGDVPSPGGKGGDSFFSYARGGDGGASGTAERQPTGAGGGSASVIEAFYGDNSYAALIIAAGAGGQSGLKANGGNGGVFDGGDGANFVAGETISTGGKGGSTPDYGAGGQPNGFPATIIGGGVGCSPPFNQPSGSGAGGGGGGLYAGGGGGCLTEAQDEGIDEAAAGGGAGSSGINELALSFRSVAASTDLALIRVDYVIPTPSGGAQRRSLRHARERRQARALRLDSVDLVL